MAALKNQFKLSSGDRYFIARECGGTVSLDDVVELLQKTDDYEDFMLERDIFSEDDIFHHYGATTIIDSILTNPNDKYDLNDYPDPLDYPPPGNLGKIESIDLDSYYPEQDGYEEGDKIQGQDHFFHYAYGVEKGYWNYEAFKVVDTINTKFLKPIFFDESRMGIISHYLYDDKTSGESIEIYGELIESRPAVDKSAYLFANTSEGLKQIWFDEIKNEMQKEGLNTDDNNACKNYLIKKYNFKL